MNCVVIGANRGIGLEFCRQLRERGESVWAFCRETSDALNALDVTVVEGFDVADNFDNLLQLSAKMDKPVDTLIHVSGVLSNESLQDLNFERIQHQFNINSIGPLKSVMAFKQHLHSGSKVGLLTSRMGSIADNDSGGRYGYRMSKSALNSAGKSLAVDLKDENISVIILHPGYVRTDMTGGNGLIDTNESVKGMLKLIDSSTMEHSGRFFHTNGEELPW